MKNQIKRLKKIDSVIFEVYRKINEIGMYPKNLNEEKEKFFQSSDYNPQFKYSTSSLKDEFSKLKKLKFKNTIMDNLFKEKVKELNNFIKLKENIGKKDFTKYSKLIYSEPNKELINKAKEILRKETRKEMPLKRKISTKKAIKKFNEIFKALNINWEAKEENIYSNALIKPAAKKLIIKSNRHFSQREIRRFIVHEIYTHVLRAEFGLMQPYKIFLIGLAGYEETEEGFALYKERKENLLNPASMKKYALRVLAIHTSLNKSFRETFNTLKEFTDNETAWDIALRSKRGLSDTSKPGAFTKDILYLSGFFKVKEFIKNQSCLHLLHYGKIGIQHALLIPKIEGLKNPYLLLKKHFKNNISELSILY